MFLLYIQTEKWVGCSCIRCQELVGDICGHEGVDNWVKYAAGQWKTSAREHKHPWSASGKYSGTWWQYINQLFANPWWMYSSVLLVLYNVQQWTVMFKLRWSLPNDFCLPWSVLSLQQQQQNTNFCAHWPQRKPLSKLARQPSIGTCMDGKFFDQSKNFNVWYQEYIHVTRMYAIYLECQKIIHMDVCHY